MCAARSSRRRAVRARRNRHRSPEALSVDRLDQGLELAHREPCTEPVDEREGRVLTERADPFRSCHRRSFEPTVWPLGAGDLPYGVIVIPITLLVREDVHGGAVEDRAAEVVDVAAGGGHVVPLRVEGRRGRDHRMRKGRPGLRADALRVAVEEHRAVGTHEEVALVVRREQEPNDLRRKVRSRLGAVEGGVAVVEHVPERGHEVIAPAVRRSARSRRSVGPWRSPSAPSARPRRRTGRPSRSW